MKSLLYLIPVDAVFPVTGPGLKTSVCWSPLGQSQCFHQDWVKLFLGARGISGEIEAKRRTQRMYFLLEHRCCDYKSSSHSQPSLEAVIMFVLSFLKKPLDMEAFRQSLN